MSKLKGIVWYLRGSVMSRREWHRHDRLIQTLDKNLEKLK